MARPAITSLVGVGDDVYGLPIAKVSGVVETPRDALSFSQNQPMLHFGQTVVPVQELSELLEVPGAPRHSVAPFVVVEGDDGRVAPVVDQLLGQEGVVLKALARSARPHRRRAGRAPDRRHLSNRAGRELPRHQTPRPSRASW